MTLRPAYEAILRHGDHTVTLRANLRAAITIANMEGAFAAALHGITGQSLGLVCSVIRAAATDRHQAEMFLSAVAAAPLQPFMEQASAILVELIAAILPEPSNEPEQPAKAKETPGTSWAEHYASLYGFGTGWLDWTPQAVWDASPQEIETAFKAKCDHLIAMNGGDPDKPETDNGAVNIYTPAQMAQIEAEGRDPAFDRSGLHALKARL